MRAIGDGRSYTAVVARRPFPALLSANAKPAETDEHQRPGGGFGNTDNISPVKVPEPMKATPVMYSSPASRSKLSGIPQISNSLTPPATKS